MTAPARTDESRDNSRSMPQALVASTEIDSSVPNRDAEPASVPDATLEHALPATRLKVVVAWMLVSFVWGSTYLAIRVALAGFSPLLLTGIRFTIAGSLLLLISRLRGTPLPTGREWRGAALVGMLLLVGNACVVVSEQWVSSGLAALSGAAVPIWVALISGLFGHWPTRREWIGLSVGFAGIVLLNGQGDLRSQPIAVLVLLLAMISWSLGSVLTRRVPLPKGLQASGAEMLTGGAVILLAALARGERIHHAPTLAAGLALAYLIVFGAVIAFSANDYLLRHARPVVATSYTYVNPVIAVALGAALAHEPVTPLSLAALAIILFGVFLITWPVSRR